MSRSVAELKHEALDLEQHEREELVEALLSSLDKTNEIDRAWMEEVHSRYEAFRAGKSRALDHDVLHDVLALPEEDRVEIIDAALASLADPGPLSDEWKAEIDRRSREIDAGEVELIENEEVFARVRARLR